MRSTSSLIHKLKTSHPNIYFVQGEEFLWSPSNQTIFYNPDAPHAALLLLHEFSHSLLSHTTYTRDIELVAMETAAWERATELAQEYSVRLNEEVIQEHLDTYRDWLHARSICPSCTANGCQISSHTYECPACLHTWRVNEARICALRRYSLTPSAR
jgi:hypothetical protein